MTFVDEVKDFLEEHPTETYGITYKFGATFVTSETHDKRRWYTVEHTVFKKRTLRLEDSDLEWVKEEYVLVEHCEPATELQERDGLPEPTVFSVEPYEVTETRYRPV